MPDVDAVSLMLGELRITVSDLKTVTTCLQSSMHTAATCELGPRVQRLETEDGRRKMDVGELAKTVRLRNGERPRTWKDVAVAAVTRGSPAAMLGLALGFWALVWGIERGVIPNVFRPMTAWTATAEEEERP